MELITTTQDLAEACARLSQHPFVTVDTEFLRESTYYPQLCVAQIASMDEAVVVDALAPDIDLKPFFDLMGNESVLKVFHAARQDIEIVWHRAKIIPHPIFDTQVAAMVLGYGDSISYDQLVQRTTGGQIDKSSRFTDWARRPLTQQQITYAVADVTHLRDVYAKLKEDLEKKNRTSWLDSEMQILTSTSTYEQHPENAWLRLKTRARKPKEIAVLMEVAAWREREAQSRDVPRGRIIKDDVIGEIAIQQPKTAEALGQLRSIPKGFERSRSGESILQAVAAGLARDPETLPKFDRYKPLSNGASATVELLRVLLRMTAEVNGVAARVVASADDLEAIALDDNADVEALKGWRRELFGNRALDLKHGKVSLGIEGGRVVAKDV